MASASSPESERVLRELEPRVAQLLDRHLALAEEWFPHDYVPWGEGRDFASEPWTPDQVRISSAARTAFEVNLLTEDNLPSYHRLIHSTFGHGDGAWINWIHRWTAEEGRHAVVLRDYLVITRNVDPVALERARMTEMQRGFDREASDVLRSIAYVALQEMVTRIAHFNTGRIAGDPVAARITSRVSADENLHMLFYRDLLTTALELEPSWAIRAIVREMLDFAMPGSGMPGFREKAASMAAAGVYDLRMHRDEVLIPLARSWGLFDARGLDGEAEQAREQLARYLGRIDRAARRAQERLAANSPLR